MAALEDILGAGVEIALENNNFFPTGAYLHVTDADFIGQIVEENGLFLLLDVAHSKITAHNRKIAWRDYLRMLPLDRVIQAHVSRSGLRPDGLVFDAHQPLLKEDWDDLRNVLALCKNIEYVTLEVYKDKTVIVDGLKKMREVLNELSGKFVRM